MGILKIAYRDTGATNFTCGPGFGHLFIQGLEVMWKGVLSNKKNGNLSQKNHKPMCLFLDKVPVDANTAVDHPTLFCACTSHVPVLGKYEG